MHVFGPEGQFVNAKPGFLGWIPALQCKADPRVRSGRRAGVSPPAGPGAGPARPAGWCRSSGRSPGDGCAGRLGSGEAEGQAQQVGRAGAAREGSTMTTSTAPSPPTSAGSAGRGEEGWPGVEGEGEGGGAEEVQSAGLPAVRLWGGGVRAGRHGRRSPRGMFAFYSARYLAMPRALSSLRGCVLASAAGIEKAKRSSDVARSRATDAASGHGGTICGGTCLGRMAVWGEMVLAQACS